MLKNRFAEVSPVQAAKCRELAKVLIPAIRHRAHSLGYAIAVHGSLRRDIDLIACPWRDGAVDAKSLADAVQAIAKAVAGRGDQLPGEDTDYFQHGSPGNKHHGRRCWTFHLSPDAFPYIDLSVMPRAPREETMAVMGEIRAATAQPSVA